MYGCEAEELLDLQDRQAMPPHELRLLQRPPGPAPVTTLSRARHLRDRVFQLLEGHQHPRRTIELYAVAGYVCTLLAWISSDLGQLHDADTHARTAGMCATMAGDSELWAWVLSTRSKIAYWDSRPQAAIQHARHGQSYEPRGTAAILLACQEADVWAEHGAVAEAQTAMARANAARDRLTGHDEVGGLLACPEVRRANYAAGVHLRTGQPRTALQEAQAALAQPPHAHGTTAQLHVSTACAHLALGEPDAAIVALQPVLDLPQEHRMAPVTSRLRELAAATTGTPLANSRAAYELRGRIDAFCDAAPRHALSPADPVS